MRSRWLAIGDDVQSWALPRAGCGCVTGVGRGCVTVAGRGCGARYGDKDETRGGWPKPGQGRHADESVGWYAWGREAWKKNSDEWGRPVSDREKEIHFQDF